MADIVATLQRAHAGLFGDALGVQFLEAAADRVVAEIVVRPELCTTPGIMHGGAIIAFADTLGGSATSISLPKGAGTTTIESKTNFFSPARTGDTIRGECVALHRGRRTMVWQTRVTSPDGRLVALVTQTQIVLEAKQSPQQTIAALFEGKSPDEQKGLLAQLERGGAAIYRGFAESGQDASVRAAMLAAADREIENAELLEGDAEVRDER